MHFRYLSCLLLAISVALLVGGKSTVDGNRVALSLVATRDPTLTADPQQTFWKGAPSLEINLDTLGNTVPDNTMQVRSRWTQNNLYLLFACRYDVLNLKPNPRQDEETDGLWNWDVAEVFIGDDFENINRYKEFEVSPQGEWVDLDIDRSKPNNGAAALRWNSALRVTAHIDQKRKIWYAAMCIPFRSISRQAPKPGLRFRVNFYRCARKEPDRLLLNWRPTHARSFHQPESFGILELTTE